MANREPSEENEQCGGGGGPNELWMYQHPTEIRAVIDLRESIRDYVEYHLFLAGQSGVPIVQPMWYNFTDPIVWTLQTQFMFGPKYLVAPVLQPLSKSADTSVYLPTLPSNEMWVHHYTGMQYRGGQTYTITSTLGNFPLFERTTVTQEGSILRRKAAIARDD